MIANYDLSEQLCSSDHYGWLVQAAAEGATEIVFDTTRGFRPGWPDGVARRRFETMIAPAPAFLGLPSREGSDGKKIGGRAKNQTLVKFAKQNSNFRRMRSVLPSMSGDYYTITLREAEQDRWRNSNKGAWLQFAAEVNACVIDDYVVTPYRLWDLMAIFAGAKMNFGVLGGAMQLCSLSEYPCMIFNLGKHETYLRKADIRRGESLPWCGSNQLTFWEDDAYKNIHRRFRQWKLGHGYAV